MDVQNILVLIKPYYGNISAILIILVINRLLLASTGKILHLIYRHFSIPRGHYLTVRGLVRAGIYALTLVFIIVFIPGVNQQIIALIGIGLGILVSLSSTSTIGNAVAGAIIYLTRPIREGDRVEIDGVVGDVVSVELLFVHLKTIKNRIVSIPSLKVLNGKIINLSKLDTYILHVSVSLGYDLDPGEVEVLLLKAAKATDGILDDPKPFMLIRSLDDYTVQYEINGHTDKPHLTIHLESELYRNILYLFSCESMQIMSPTHVALHELRHGEKVIPKHVTYCEEQKHDEVPEEKEKEKEVVEAKQKLEQKKREDIKIKT